MLESNLGWLREKASTQLTVLLLWPQNPVSSDVEEEQVE